jgi:hypothetical protein
MIHRAKGYHGIMNYAESLRVSSVSDDLSLRRLGRMLLEQVAYRNCFLDLNSIDLFRGTKMPIARSVLHFPPPDEQQDVVTNRYLINRCAELRHLPDNLEPVLDIPASPPTLPPHDDLDSPVRHDPTQHPKADLKAPPRPGTEAQWPGRQAAHLLNRLKTTPGFFRMGYDWLYTKWRRWRNRRATAQVVFDRIYRRGNWGGDGSAPMSGRGSRGRPAELYIDLIADFISRNDIKSVVDIGCGDFVIGSGILDRVPSDVSYIGIDVSAVATDYNIEKNVRLNARFVRLDASVDEVPNGQLCLVRQVLQHLSNHQISGILSKLSGFGYVIVTEHHPLEARVFNSDKPHSGDTRLADGSGVFLDRPPFNVTSMARLLEVEAEEGTPSEGKIVSWLIDVRGAARTFSQSSP